MSKKWIDDKIDVNKLNLDLQNPRLPQHVRNHNDVTQVRNYLLDKEDVIKIARSIANNGYHKSAVAIVCKENDKLIVLDGNRRLAACQFLLEPKLAPNAHNKKILEDLNKRLDKEELENIKIAIAPSRKEAEKEIWDIHVNQLLKPWEVLQKLRMHKNLIDSGEYTVDAASKERGITATEFKNELAQLYFYEQISEKTDLKGEEELLSSGFNKIHRLILSQNGKKLLNYVVNDNGDITIANQTDFDSKLQKLIPYIVIKDKVSPQAKKEELERKVYSEIDPINFPIKKGTKTPSKSHKKSTAHTKVKPDWITSQECMEYKGADRVRDMLEEMKNNKPEKKQNVNILAVSLRVVIELAIYSKLKDRGDIQKIIKNKQSELKIENAKRIRAGKPTKPMAQDWTPNLKEMLKFILDEANQIIVDPHDRKAIGKVSADSKEFIEDLNLFMHNVAYHPTETKINTLWKTFGRPVFEIISKIQ